jgi:hypothetical protein
MSHLIEALLSDREARELAKFLPLEFGLDKRLKQYPETTALLKIQASLLDSLESQRELSETVSIRPGVDL